MKKQLAYGLALVVLGGAAAPAAAAPPPPSYSNFHTWAFCSGNALSVCMNFDLQRDGTTDNFKLVAMYVNPSVGSDGIMTGVGLYRDPSDTDLNVANVSVLTPGSWVVSSTGLSGGGNVLFEVAGSSSNGATDGVPMGGYVEITFSSTNLASYNIDDYLHARSHVQSLGEFNCSLKPDSYLADNVVDGAAAVDARCGDGGGTDNTVPEPVSMILLGSGLLGLGAVRMRRRQK